MSMVVPEVPPMSADGDSALPAIRNALPVIGTGQWQTMGRQSAWLLGHGATLVAAGPDLEPLTAGDDFEFRFQAQAHAQHLYRLWVVSLSCDDTGASGKIKTLDGVTELKKFTISGGEDTMASHTRHVVYAVEQATAGDDLGIMISMDADSTEEAFVVSIGCFELPLKHVEPGDHPDVAFPVDASLATKEPIFDDETTHEVSVTSVVRAAREAETDARRVCLFSCHFLQAIPETGATFVNPLGGEIPVLARKRYDGEAGASRTITVWVYAIGVGQVRVTAATGDTFTLTYNTPGAYEWQSGTIDVDAEDVDTLDTDGGLQSATRDTLLVEIRCTDTVLGLKAVCGGEID